MADLDLIDHRQRHAAALLLSAVDLPQPFAEIARIWIAAAEVCPGITVDQLRLNSRLDALRRARELIDQLLTEAGCR